LSLQNDNVASILAHYYQTLSIDMVKEFIDSLQRAAVVSKELKPNVERSNEPEDIHIIPLQPKDIDKEKEAGSSKIQILPVDINLDDIEVLSYIANSINPYTGELITGIDDSLRERLFDIIQNIKQSKIQITNRTNIATTDSMIGKPWGKDEESKLIEEFNQGLKISGIAKLHNRNNGGIRARLKRLGLVE
jgi:hypothetical protein